jgi:hypothetical protein
MAGKTLTFHLPAMANAVIHITHADVARLMKQLFKVFRAKLRPDENDFRLASYDFADSTVTPVCNLCQKSPKPQSDEWVGLTLFPDTLACNGCYLDPSRHVLLTKHWFARYALPQYFVNPSVRLFLTADPTNPDDDTNEAFDLNWAHDESNSELSFSYSDLDDDDEDDNNKTPMDVDKST